MTNTVELRTNRNLRDRRPHQIMHLRWMTAGTPDSQNVIEPLGGFTIAYFAVRNDEKKRIDVTYSHTECPHDQNFYRKHLRAIAANRLAHKAPLYTKSFYIGYSELESLNDLDEFVNLDSVLFSLDERGTVDIKESVVSLKQRVTNHFVVNCLATMYEFDDSDEAITQFGKQHFLNSSLIENTAVYVGVDRDNVDDLLFKLEDVHSKLSTALDAVGNEAVSPSEVIAFLYTVKLIRNSISQALHVADKPLR